jgi:hypothetical protein
VSALIFGSCRVPSRGIPQFVKSVHLPRPIPASPPQIASRISGLAVDPSRNQLGTTFEPCNSRLLTVGPIDRYQGGCDLEEICSRLREGPTLKWRGAALEVWGWKIPYLTEKEKD